MTVQSRPIVEVAVGILLKEGKEVLMGKRPEGKPYAGYWEFPGGKLEAGESVELALHRELKEELGIVTVSYTHLTLPTKLL
jgi:8-oxo-dGTP diphosphatase